MIDIIPDKIVLCIISQLEEEDLCNVAQVYRRFNRLTEQHRELRYIDKNFDTLMIEYINTADNVGTRSKVWWLARRHPERKCSPKVFRWVSAYGYAEVVKLLLKANKLCTPNTLDLASVNGHAEIVKLLLAAGTPYSDCTSQALDVASENGYTEVVKLLLAADKPCTTNALDWASFNDHTEIIKLLLEAGVRIRTVPYGHSLGF